MSMNIRAKVHISDKLRQAMRQAPKIVSEEMTEGMQEVKTIRARIRGQISQMRLVERGRLSRSLSARVRANQSSGRVDGYVAAGARYAGIHEHGGTIRAKRGKFLVFPLGERVEITHVQRRNGEWRELKQTRMETINVSKWIRVKSVKIRPKWYFRRGVRQGLPAVERSLERSAHRAMRRVFADEEG